MQSATYSPDALELWSRPPPGQVAPWVRVFVSIAAGLSLVAAVVGVRALVAFDGVGCWQGVIPLEADALYYGPALILALIVAASLARPARVSRFARLAVVLPFAHLVVLAIVAGALVLALPSLERVRQFTPMLRHLPLAPLAAGTLLGSIAIARLVAWGRPGQARHAFVTFTLIHLLVFGIWLAIATRLLPREIDVFAWSEWGEARRGLPWVALVPSVAIAAAATCVAIRWPATALALRGPVVTIVGCAGLGAVICRFQAPIGTFTAYDNFMHVLGVLAAVAVGALAYLAVATARDRRSAGVVVGPIVDTGVGAVGHVEIAGWLRGPRTSLEAITIATRAGDVRLPAGARLVAEPPLETTVLHIGEPFPVLRAGDTVAVAGLERATEGSPYRGSAGYVPGASGVLVQPVGGGDWRTRVALVMWRPCVAYLAITTIVLALALLGSRA